MTALEVKLPDGCEVTVHPDERDGAQQFAVACAHEHEGRWRFEVIRADGAWRARTAGTQQALAVAVETDVPAPRAAVGEVRTWSDYMGHKRQGRVTSVSDRDVTIALGTGSVAVVRHEQLDPPEAGADQEGVAEARAAQVERARAWLDTTLTTRLTDALTGAWQALTEIDPEADSDELKLKAAELVTGKANDLAAQLARHVAQRAGRVELKDAAQEPTPYANACFQCGTAGEPCEHRP